MIRRCLAVTAICLLAAATAFAQTGDRNEGEITGTVMTVTDNMIVVRTDAGDRTFMIDPGSDVPRNVASDQRVTVTYYPDPAATANDRWIVAAVQIDEPASPPQQRQSAATDAQQQRSRLPQTATPLAGIALLGLGSLGGYLALRRKDRSR